MKIDDENVLYFISEKGFEDLNSPYALNHFNITEAMDSISSIKAGSKLYRDYFEDENTRIIILAVLALSVLISRFKSECRIDIHRIVLLNSTDYSSSILLLTADMFLNVFDRKGYPVLEQKKKDLTK